MAQLEARRAHNPEVTRSKRVVAISFAFFYCRDQSLKSGPGQMGRIDSEDKLCSVSLVIESAPLSGRTVRLSRGSISIYYCSATSVVHAQQMRSESEFIKTSRISNLSYIAFITTPNLLAQTVSSRPYLMHELGAQTGN